MLSRQEELQKRLLVTSRDGEIRWKETLSAAVLATASFLQVLLVRRSAAEFSSVMHTGLGNLPH